MLLESIAYYIFIKAPTFIDSKNIISIAADMLLFVLVLILERILDRRNLHRERIQKIYVVHWLAILLIPVSSIIIVVTAFLSEYSPAATIINVSLLLGINVLVFYLYDVLMQYYGDKYEKDLLKRQINAYANQLEIIKTSENNIKMLRHDMKNHISTMRNMLLNDKKLELLNYIDRTYDHIDIKKEYARSGNSDVDSIINYKIAEAEKVGAVIDVAVNLPDKINIETFDLNVILGNLIDNAVEALKKSERKELKIEIELDRSVLYITVTNSYCGKIRLQDGKIMTTKKDTQNHGIGLSSIENVLKKYNGTIDVDYNSSTFEVNILLYNPIDEFPNKSNEFLH
jgi:sensor histidine kinase YesM